MVGKPGVEPESAAPEAAVFIRYTTRPHGNRIRARTGICRLGGDGSVLLSYAVAAYSLCCQIVCLPRFAEFSQHLLNFDQVPVAHRL